MYWHNGSVFRVVLSTAEHRRPHGIRPSGDDGVVAADQQGQVEGCSVRIDLLDATLVKILAGTDEKLERDQSVVKAMPHFNVYNAPFNIPPFLVFSSVLRACSLSWLALGIEPVLLVLSLYSLYILFYMEFSPVVLQIQ